MNEFSSDEMRRLQDEAKKRVLDMKTRSRFLTEDINKEFSEPSYTDNRFINPNRKAKSIKFPIDFPKTEENGGIEEKTAEVQISDLPTVAVKTKQRKPAKTSAVLDNFFSDLSDDDLERLFILSLCLLLNHEQTDEEVVLALMYILS